MEDSGQVQLPSLPRDKSTLTAKSMDCFCNVALYGILKGCTKKIPRTMFSEFFYPIRRIGMYQRARALHGIATESHMVSLEARI